MILALERVEKTYAGSTGDVAALRGVDLQVSDGDFVLLEGKSGAGKTTLLNVAGLLDEPTRGRVLFDGAPVAAMRARDRAALRLRRMGFVFQHYYLVPDLSVLENVALPAMAAGAPATDASRRALDLLARVGVADTAGRLPRELSGGEQQRAGIARALVNRPRLLLADEPTGNLDAGSASDVAALLGDVHRQGTTVLLVTHDPERFLANATRRLRLDAGRVVAT